MTSLIDVARVDLDGSDDGLRVTPYEAMVRDLLFIREELEMAGIPFLLIRGADGRPALPVYNSHAVESQLHHIPGLAEHFLYSNDDMFFGRALSPTIFSPGGVTKFIEARERIGLGANNPERSGFENAARVNRQLLWEKFGKIFTRHLEHTAVPLRKSVLLELEREFSQDFSHKTLRAPRRVGSGRARISR
jgi:hypothetical protein